MLISDQHSYYARACTASHAPCALSVRQQRRRNNRSNRRQESCATIENNRKKDAKANYVFGLCYILTFSKRTIQRTCSHAQLDHVAGTTYTESCLFAIALAQKLSFPCCNRKSEQREMTSHRLEFRRCDERLVEIQMVRIICGVGCDSGAELHFAQNSTELLAKWIGAFRMNFDHSPFTVSEMLNNRLTTSR